MEMLVQNQYYVILSVSLAAVFNSVMVMAQRIKSLDNKLQRISRVSHVEVVSTHGIEINFIVGIALAIELQYINDKVEQVHKLLIYVI